MALCAGSLLSVCWSVIPVLTVLWFALATACGVATPSSWSCQYPSQSLLFCQLYHQHWVFCYYISCWRSRVWFLLASACEPANRSYCVSPCLAGAHAYDASVLLELSLSVSSFHPLSPSQLQAYSDAAIGFWYTTCTLYWPIDLVGIQAAIHNKNISNWSIWIVLFKLPFGNLPCIPWNSIVEKIMSWVFL